MITIIIVLAWLLFNTWATLAMANVYHLEIQGWRDLRDIIFLAIVSPWWFIIFRYIRKLFKKRG